MIRTIQRANKKINRHKTEITKLEKKKKSCNFFLTQLPELIRSRERKMPAADTVVQQPYRAEVCEQVRHRSRVQASLLSTGNHWHLFLSYAFFLTLLSFTAFPFCLPQCGWHLAVLHFSLSSCSSNCLLWVMRPAFLSAAFPFGWGLEFGSLKDFSVC